MILRVDASSHTPIYRQVMDQIRFAIAAGRLKAHEKLPGSRELARELSVNLQTIAKAYAELAREGVVEMRRGRGTFVTDARITTTERARERRLERAAQKLCIQARDAGWSLDELTDRVRRAWDEEMRS